MSTNMTFEEASLRLNTLVASVGGTVNAYRDDESRTALPMEFVEAEAQIRSLEEQMDTSDVFAIEEEDTRDLEEALRRVTGEQDTPVPHEKVAAEFGEEDLDTEYMCATGLDGLEDALMPEQLDPDTYTFHNVVECLGSLEEVWKAFERARRTGEEQTFQVDNRTLTVKKSGQSWSLLDEIYGIRYLEATSDDVSARNVLQEGDLFLWVLSPDDETSDDMGYIHNGYVFKRK